jgi:hypothetical protein
MGSISSGRLATKAASQSEHRENPGLYSTLHSGQYISVAADHIRERRRIVVAVNPLALLASLTALVALAGGGKPGTPLACRLSAAGAHPAAGPVTVRFVLKNTGSREVAVLTWQTPLEGLLGDVFRITTADGKEIPYRGPMVKRGDPDADEYVRIPPHGEASGEVDAAAAYDLSRPGRYTVSFRGSIHDVSEPKSAPRPRSAHEPAALECPAVEIEVVPGP